MFKHDHPDANHSDPITVPCGQCIGCRLERSRQWAIRCIHEASLYEDNCFITLTYNDENLPRDWSLDKSHFQKFMKRLRKANPSRTIRYFQCGEYGDENLRPHYHACIFNYDFPDRVLHSNNDGNPLYTSEYLDTKWTHGHCYIGDVTFDSAAYVARYIMKKVNGELAEKPQGKFGLKYYERVNDHGEIHQVEPEYTTMSRRPGIASDWLKRYQGDVYPFDEVIVKGRSVKPPKFYDKQLELTNPEMFETIKEERLAQADLHSLHNTRRRLAVRKKVKQAQIQQLKRKL